ncbi:hypothetical protein PQR33_22730 [Paraburkholderia sediminicola]|uniref:hypothetical protein n=1 Tax=Paraburkholderia sediminicola TaxID=458836 RepID=UPI0038BA7B6C
MRTRVSLIPAEPGDPNKWAPVPEAAFEGNEKSYETYQRRELAVRLYFQNVPCLQIQSETGICKKEVIRHVKACVSSVAGVRSYGFYALIPHNAAETDIHHRCRTKTLIETMFRSFNKRN